MASIKQSTVLNFSQINELGFQLPQSNLQFNDWRNHPSVFSSRQRVLVLIQAYLKQNACGEFTREIADLAAYLENQLYVDAASEEDYLNGKTFYDRLRARIHQKWFEAKSAYKQSLHNTTSLPMYNAGKMFGMPSNIGVTLKKPFDDYIMTADNSNHSQWNVVTDVTSQHIEPVTPNIFSPHGGFSGGDPLESGPTFSGSVLQYDSEASFKSHRVTPCFPENEPNKKRSSSQRSDQFLHTGFPVRGVSNGYKQMTGPADDSTISDDYMRPTKLRKLNSCSPRCGLSRTEESISQLGFQAPVLVNTDPCTPKVNVEMVNNDACKMTVDGEYGNMDDRGLQYDSEASFESHRVTRHFPEDEPNKKRSSNQMSPSFPTNEMNCDSIDGGICGRTYSTGLSNGLKQTTGPSDDGTISDDYMRPTKLRKLNSCSPRCGLSESISQLEFQAPVLVNTDPCTVKVNLETVNTGACKMTVDGEYGNINDGGLQGSYSETAPDSSCEDLNGTFKEEIGSATTSEPNDEAVNPQNEGTLMGSEMGDANAEGNGDKSDKQKVEGITVTEYFTAEEIKVHIASLREKADQNIATEEIGNASSGFVNENNCQICTGDRLAFPPMPIYCQSCSVRIKNFATYYSSRDENRAQICFCTTCYNKARGGYITICGLSILKSDLVMKRNNLVTEESWVQCDKCEGWQHQICALFNDKRDSRGKAEYVCPKCYLEDLKSETRMPLPRTAAFDAHKLPRTLLSDHIEQRLFSHLKRERENRARASGKSVEEVPEPDNLVVRVVSAVDKVLKVKQQFLDIFPENNYPPEFPYRSKVILLFQKIEGVDVCLFAMYVQEFGSECRPPNQRCIYISYLDSVKYFRPEIKTVSGEALRTYVYHEILVGYLDYCKKRGFATCYIWACPPVKGEDYILYCHPESQKTPKPDKLRQWYQLMLKKASKENIVVNFSNLYEKFFVGTGEVNTKVTAARLPYFEGDYWSSVAENMIKKIEDEDQQLKVKKLRRRCLKSMGHENPSPHNVKDILLMMELGQRISAAKEDFIIVYLQFVCTQCHEAILSGTRWFCAHCKNFQLCQRCHDTDPEQGDTHISCSGQKHALAQETVNDVPNSNTEDNDDIIDNCFLENRHAFLNFCQGNHYQFDSLRRAKHSSMIILYHLHNPSGSDTGSLCSLCLNDIGADLRWKCEVCIDFSVCDSCYQRNNGFCHCHALSRHPLAASNVVDDKKDKMVEELLDVVQHASQCRSVTHPCSYPNCILIRKLFSHAQFCKIRVAGGCVYCKKTWFVLMTHSQRCKDSNCGVPRCMDLKKKPMDLPPFKIDNSSPR